MVDAGREPTPEELDTIAAYIGWGSFGQELFKGTWDNPQPKDGWKEQDEWLREHLGEEAWKGAQNSIINAHYTDPPTVQAMWSMVEKMGFKGGRVLEPSMGIGNFFGLMPRKLMEKSELTGIELDPTTGGMARMLYPDANVRVMGYEESKTPDGFYDLVIGNWPFANFQPADRRYDRLGASLHDYFFVKAIDQVRPGGIVMGITSSFTMDGVKNRAIKSYLAKRAELVASFRLPTGAFEGYAGTAVVTDIIILKKREEQILDTSDEAWTRSSEYKLPTGRKLRLNEYYHENHSNILGQLDIGHGTTFGKEGMIVNRLKDFPETLAALPNRVPANAFSPFNRKADITYVANNTTDRVGSVVKGDDGEFYRVEGDQMARLDDVAKWKLKDEKKTAARREQIEGLIDLRKAAGAVLDADRDGLPDAEKKRKALKKQFTALTKKFGRIRDMDGLKALRRANDPNADLLQALEREDGTPATILDKPVIRAKKELKDPSITQAYVAARNESTTLNLERVAEIAGEPLEEVTSDLLGRKAVYRTPGGGFEASEVYLSGNVRQKLKDAEAAAASGEDMAGSIEALKGVIPEDVPYFDIEARMGADWMPKEDTEDFIADKLGITGGRVELRRGASGWNVTVPDEIARRGDISTFTGAPLPGKGGTGLSLKRFLEAALNTQTVKVTQSDGDGGATADPESTDKANARLGEVRMQFKDWVWTDPDRRIRLEAAYNDAMNAIATPQYDGSFLEFPGLALEFGDKPFNLRSHQRNAIWRGLLNRRGIYGHEVGTGKSLTIAGIAIESRRYGIAKKPLVVGHNANARALADEIQSAYPGAKVLFVDNLSPKTIGSTLNQIATDDWDAVVIPHSLIDRMALSEKTLMAMAEEDIAAFEAEALAAAEEEGVELTVEEMGDGTEEMPDDLKKRLFRSPTAKEAVKARNRLISSLRKQASKAAKENAVPFEDLGLDMILVDECFTWDTPILTDRGWLPIGKVVDEKLPVRVLSCNLDAKILEWKPIVRWLKIRRRNRLVEVRHGSGHFTCTEDHKVWTQRGYVEAGSLLPTDSLFFLRRDVHAVRPGNHEMRSLHDDNEAMPGLRSAVQLPHEEGAGGEQGVLLGSMQDAGAAVGPDLRSQMERVHAGDMGQLAIEGRAVPGEFGADAPQEPDAQEGDTGEGVESPFREDVSGARREWAADRASGEAFGGTWSAYGVPDLDGPGEGAIQEPSAMLQGGSGEPGAPFGDRSGREFAPDTEMALAGCPQDLRLECSRVESVAVLEREGVGRDGRGDPRNQFVYDIEVAENHNFFAAGALVSNCHEFKKPPVATRMAVRGLNKGTSARSMQLKFLTRYVKTMRGGDGIHTFTGTPITNTLTEIYHQMTYVMDDVMRENYVDTWDGFFKTFADSIADIEVTSAGDYENVERLAAFVNVSELRRMAGQYLDIVFAEEMPEFTPRTTASGKTIKSPDLTEEERDFLENGRTENPIGRPYKKIVHDIGEMGDDQRAILDEVVQHATAFRNADGKTRREIMLEGGPDAPIVYNNVPNRASMDARLHDMGAEDHPQSKANRAVRNIASIYHSDPMAAQVLFMDEGFSDTATRKSGDSTVTVPKLNLAKDIKAKLVSQGIKEDEIIIVGGGVSADKKAEIARKMNNLEARVVIGQTRTLGVGVNMQKYLRAMHHLDAPWMPGELEQRNGRGERQGNTWNTVLEIRYLTEGLDGRRWQVLAIKDRFIKAFMKAKQGVRVIEGDATDDSENMDAGSLTDTLSEAAGDPRIMLLAKASKKVERLDQRKRTHELGVSDALRRVKQIELSMRRRSERLKADAPAVEAAQKAIASDFEMKIDKTTYDKRADAGAALSDKVKSTLATLSMGQSAKVAATRGFDIIAMRFSYGPEFWVKRGDFETVASKPSIASIDAALRKIAKSQEAAAEADAEDRATLERLKAASKQEFRQAEELKKAQATVAEITADLEMNPVPAPSWLRQGAPVDTVVFVDGDERVVTGHRWTDDGWFLQTDKGTVPYTKATSETGVPIYEEREFQAPKVEEGSKMNAGTEKASVSAEIRTGFQSSEALRDHFERGPLGDFIVKLIGSGRIVLHDTPKSLPGASRAGVQGITTSDGVVHIVASGVNEQTANAVLLHEFFHSGGEALLGEAGWRSLLDRVDRIASTAAGRGGWWDAALRRGDGSAEEIAAYAIETRESAPRGLAEIADNLIGMVKAFVLRKLGRQLGRVTPGQLRSLAIAAVRSAGSGGRGPNGGLRYSMADTMASRVIGAERKILSQALTQAMAGAGGTNLLGLVPGRALFAELAAKMPAAQEYLRLKGLMDTLRNEWHERMDTTAQEWRKQISKHGAANEDMMDIMHESTLHGVDPSRPVMKFQGDGKDEARKPVYARLRERYKALPHDMQQVFQKVRDEYKALNDEFEKTLLDNIGKAMDLGVHRAEREHAAEMRRIVDEGMEAGEAVEVKERADRKLAGVKRRLGWNKRARMADMRAKMETQRIAEPYFPLARFGQFFVTARDEDGKIVSFSRFESVRQRDKEADYLTNKGLEVEVGALGETKLRDMVDATFVNDVEAILMDAGVSEAVMDQVWQRWLDTMPDMSLRKSRIHRKGTPGWNQDAFRAFGHHMFHGSHQLARLKYSMEMSEALAIAREQANRQDDPTRAQLIVNEMERRDEHVMNPKGSAWAQHMTSAAFYYYLAVTPAAALVNLSQTSIVGTAILGAFHGKGGTRAASRQLLRAGRDFFHGKGHAAESDRLTQDEKDAMAAAYNRGTIDKSQAHDLAGVGDTGVKYSAFRSKWAKRLSWTFHQTERMNREVTYLAAYRMAREKGLDHMNAVDKAADLTWKTHFDYQSSSRPRFMTADWARVVFTFRNFQVNMLWRLFRDAHQSLHGASKAERTEARRQLIGISAMLLAHAGIRGVWGYGLIMTLLAMFTPGDADDLEDEMKGAITGLLGNQIGGMLLNGVPGHLPELVGLDAVDLTARIGMPDLWFRSPNRQLEGKDEYLYWVEQMLGPVFAMVGNQFVGLSMIEEGEAWRGIEKMVPKLPRDIMRGARYADEGATTFKGDPILEDLSPYQVVMQVVGFTPAELSEQYDRNRLMKNREAKIDNERSKILTDYTRALRDGKQPSDRIVERLREFNAKYPMWAIGPDTISRSLRARIRSSQDMTGGISLNDRIEPLIRSGVSDPIYR